MLKSLGLLLVGFVCRFAAKVFADVVVLHYREHKDSKGLLDPNRTERDR